MNTQVERIRNQRRKRYGKIRFFTFFVGIILFSIFSVMVPSIPGTFAWFTSETEATGIIQNATTADLLTIQASEITYGENCTLGNALSIKNISALDTTVRVSVVTSKGEQILKEQHVNPNETLLTNPEDLTAILPNECSTDHIEYRIHAFINFVDEPFVVTVDQSKMKEMSLAPAVKIEINNNTEKQQEKMEQEEQQPQNEPANEV